MITTKPLLRMQHQVLLLKAQPMQAERSGHMLGRRTSSGLEQIPRSEVNLQLEARTLATLHNKMQRATLKEGTNKILQLPNKGQHLCTRLKRRFLPWVVISLLLQDILRVSLA